MPQLKAAQELLFTSNDDLPKGVSKALKLVGKFGRCLRHHKNIRATLEQNPYRCFSTMTYLL